MNVVAVIPPYAEPVSVDALKAHIKRAAEVTEDDLLIAAQGVTARVAVETGTGVNRSQYSVMVATTFEAYLDSFTDCNYSRGHYARDWYPGYSYLRMPCGPLISVESIMYVDAGGSTQTLSPSNYTFSRISDIGTVIHPVYGSYWPSIRYQPSPVTIRFVAGMMAPFTAVASTDVITVLGRTFAVGDRVRLMNSGGSGASLPGGLYKDTDYFIKAGGLLSPTSGGATVDITSAGSGTHFIGLSYLAEFASLQAAIKLEVGRLYANRGDGDWFGVDTLQRTIDSLVASGIAT